MRIRAFFSKGKPHRVFRFRYENPDFLRKNGEPHFRTITVPVGWGRFEVGKEAAALELAERRLSEAYGSAAVDREARRRDGVLGVKDNGDEYWISRPIPGYVDEAAEALRRIPEAHQDGYVLVSVERIK